MQGSDLSLFLGCGQLYSTLVVGQVTHPARHSRTITMTITVTAMWRYFNLHISDMVTRLLLFTDEEGTEIQECKKWSFVHCFMCNCSFLQWTMPFAHCSPITNCTNSHLWDKSTTSRDKFCPLLSVLLQLTAHIHTDAVKHYPHLKRHVLLFAQFSTATNCTHSHS